MLARMLRPLISLLTAILEEESARVLAASIAYGLLLGFIPKDNLLAGLLGMLLLALRFNLTVATATAALSSGVAVMLDPVANVVGKMVLTLPLLDRVWLWLYEWPLVPWTRFNNTVVMGSLVMALAAALPTYVLARRAIERFRPGLAELVQKYNVDQLFRAAQRADAKEAG